MFGGMEIECVACNGSGCKNCNNGFFTIDQCPKRLVDNQTIDVFRLSDSKKEGVLAVGGGYLDQSASLMEAISYYDSDVSNIESEQRKK